MNSTSVLGDGSYVLEPLVFRGFPKIPRLNRDIVITEKIDGTNASILITDKGDMYAGKRSDWCTPEKDNHGFATWVQANKQELLKLGPGRYFGEWWGKGINRGYGLSERRFSLFSDPDVSVGLPACVSVVPVLYSGVFSCGAITAALHQLRSAGSVAAPGWMKPEGIVVFHTAASQRFKVTLENDEGRKTDKNPFSG
jgi:hypothetical protein